MWGGRNPSLEKLPLGHVFKKGSAAAPGVGTDIRDPLAAELALNLPVFPPVTVERDEGNVDPAKVTAKAGRIAGIQGDRFKTNPFQCF